ncbi:MAG: Uma2 family endonuclease [Leptolyngbyaceae cyanobacterium RU_5_1]|nr:Uma2 family endonuclease [Leptolyngbyaceae cyanobacterium RU_5_1]
MTTTRSKLTFEDYLSYDDGTDSRYELVEGYLVTMPPESGLNDWIALNLRDELVRLVSRYLVRVHTCELEVPVIKAGQPQNRYPDVVVLEPEHMALIEKRLTIRLSVPAPDLVVEVVSLGDENVQRDYQDKREQYQARGIPEYWIVDPQQRLVTVLELVLGQYVEVGKFRGSDRIQSKRFEGLPLTVEQVLG